MIELKHISKEYVTENSFKKVVLKSVSCQLQRGKITSIIAAKGYGLTTLSKIICGLESATSGEIKKGEDERLIYIPSEPASFPWRNVFDNVTFVLKHFDKDEIMRLIKLVGLEGYEKFHPHKDSFGFRFRISLARSLTHKPALVILDDCFHAMNHQTKSELYSLIKAVNVSDNVGFLVATSNVSEALMLSNRIYLMKDQPCEVTTPFDVRPFDISEINSSEFISWRIQIENEFKKTSSQSLSCISI